MRRTNLLLTACSLLFTCTACTSNAPPETANTNAPPVADAPTVNPTPAQIVRASADAVKLKAGASGATQVRLQIADGYHINANPATFSYLKATELEVAAGAGLTPGKPAYPPPVLKKFKFAPQPLAVYEHEAMIRVPLRAGATQGTQTLHTRVQVQACDEEKCFPPTTVETDIAVTIN